MENQIIAGHRSVRVLLRGILDGGGKKIKNLYCRVDGRACLIRNGKSCEVHDLFLDEVDMTGSSAAALVGNTFNSSYWNIGVRGSIVAESSNGIAGGIAAEMDQTANWTNFQACFISGEIDAPESGSVAGGLVGKHTATIYGRDLVISANIHAGSKATGIAHRGWMGGFDVQNALVLGRISSEKAAYPMTDIGFDSIYNSFYNLNLTGVNDGFDENKHGRRMEYGDIFKKSSFENWDFESTWNIDEGVTAPYLRWLDSVPPEVTKEYLDTRVSDEN